MDKHPAEFQKLFSQIDLADISFLHMFDAFHEGVTITDTKGKILYINAAQVKMDDLKVEDVLGKLVQDVYRVDEGVSPTIQCLRNQTAVTNLAIYYRTRLGRMVNSIHNVYPLFASNKLYGAIIYVTDYGSLDPAMHSKKPSTLPKRTKETVESVIHRKHHCLANGTRFKFNDIIGHDRNFTKAVRSASLASDSPSPIMLYGETGCGKELFAQSIHNHSSRRSSDYIAVNCAAIPENLLEGILFGTTKGAFTGAVDQQGLMEQANGGTLFLDEVNSMSLSLQAKLLRVLQERKVRRVGSLQEVELDIKLLSSVNQDPREAIHEGNLRADLMYRLGVVFITIPPLRNRPVDIESLAYHFLYACNQLLNKKIQGISNEVLQLFQNYQWPGNVRELEHIIEGAVNMVQNSNSLQLQHLSVHLADASFFDTAQQSDQDDPLEEHKLEKVTIRDFFAQSNRSKVLPKKLAFVNKEYEREAIHLAMIEAEGNASLAGRKLGVSPQLMHYKLRRYNIDAKTYKPASKFKII